MAELGGTPLLLWPPRIVVARSYACPMSLNIVLPTSWTLSLPVTLVGFLPGDNIDLLESGHGGQGIDPAAYNPCAGRRSCQEIDPPNRFT